ncbi:hypothetical protein MICRO11B_40029 [Micrococcus luteus]|nr:hypothetical protein MICRO11B_40029 [Micrococcus luteus]
MASGRRGPHGDPRGRGGRHGRAPVLQVPGRADGGRPVRLRPAHHHPGGHHRLRGGDRGQVLRPHGRGGRHGQPVLPAPRRPRLPAGLVGRGAVRGPGSGPGAGQLRPGEPALHHAGDLRRRHPRDPDGQAHHPARERRVRRGGLGLPDPQPEGRALRPVRRADARGQDLADGPVRDLPGLSPPASTGRPVRPLRAGRPVVVPGNKERARDVHLYVPFGPREKKVDIYVRVHPF